MFNQNQELLVATLDGERLKANLTPFTNKQGETMNLNSNKPKGNKKLTAKFRLYKKHYEKDFILNGREAQALIALAQAKQKGITALEISSWALRLSAYIFNLRKESSLDILTIREPHKGGNHGRFILQDHVEILEVFDPKNQQ